MANNELNLLPCPHCAGVASLEDHRLQWGVVCGTCGACVLGARAAESDGTEPDSYWIAIRKTAIAAWNRRPAPAQGELSDAEIERLWQAHTVPVFGRVGINPNVFARAIEQRIRGQVSDAADAARLDRVYQMCMVEPFIAPIATKEAWLARIDASIRAPTGTGHE